MIEASPFCDFRNLKINVRNLTTLVLSQRLKSPEKSIGSHLSNELSSTDDK